MAGMARNRFPPNETVATMNKLQSLLNDESGQDLAEYAMILGLIALAVLVAVTLRGTSVSTTLTDIDTVLESSM
jgi:Flp pilus assembly pilin Flp